MPRRRDEGSVLPLVLVLIIVAGLIVIPLLSYAVTIFKANTVVSDRTKQTEAAKGALRVALSDPRHVFLECDGGGDLTPVAPVANGYSVTTTCTELEEIGPLEALGFEVPRNAVAMQLGATVPASFSGSLSQSPPVPPYPASPDWWSGSESPTATADTIWMPDLPRRPGETRSSVPFTMPGGFNCQVFFPGYYPDGVDVPNGNVYFASGVYYFEDTVTIDGDADVVVGYGLEDFPSSDCADDIQVASNVISGPSKFDINGGGATWVFGDDGGLVVDDSATTTSLKLRFNQRYADEDRGGRINIMTVNGDDVAGGGDHLVTKVNQTPRSQVLAGSVRTPVPGTPVVGANYIPSNSAYTDKARLPQPPGGLTLEPLQTPGADPDRGAVLVTWDEPSGQDAGGALIDSYRVRVRPDNDMPGSFNACNSPDDVVVEAGRVSCLVTGLDIDRLYQFRVFASNEVGQSASFTADVTTPLASSPLVERPDAPTGLTVVPTDVPNIARAAWTPPADNGGAPIVRYDVTAFEMTATSPADVAPVAPASSVTAVHGVTVTAGLPVFDVNGDDLSLVVDFSGFPGPDWVIAPDDTDDTVVITASPAVTPGPYSLPYTVTDLGGNTTPGVLTIDVVAVPGASVPPVALPLVLEPTLGADTTVRAPAFDPDGLPLAATDPITVDIGSATPVIDPLEWTITVTGRDITINTTAPDGVYSIPYTATDQSGAMASSTIEVTVVRDSSAVASCSVVASTGVSLANECEFAPLMPLPGTSLGYRFTVEAVNAVGQSDPTTTEEPWPLAFDGSGTATTVPTERIVVPWTPDRKIVDIDVSGAAATTVSVAGYIAVPMGQVQITNPGGEAVVIDGGIMAGTYSVNDSRATGSPGSLPIGFKNDIVLQRKVSIVSTAGSVTSTAIVQLNEDGAGYAINAWVVD